MERVGVSEGKLEEQGGINWEEWGGGGVLGKGVWLSHKHFI